MPFLNLQIHHFRNLAQVEVELGPSLNVLEGENAQGKTNFLEVLYFLANGRSFRTTDLSSLVPFGEEAVQLKATLTHGELQSTLTAQIRDKAKEFHLQGKLIRRMTKVFEILRVLIFTPESTGLFRTSPGARRRYFDLALSRHRSRYASLLSRYRRVLTQRNQILERGGPPEVREAFDGQWAELAYAILLERQAHLEELLPLWRERLQLLGPQIPELAARWEGKLSARQPSSVEQMREILASFREEEQRYRYTAIGPQREDLQVTLAGSPAREVASQGQHRMLVIALKLAEADLFQAQTGHSPVFLLDDIGSELDPQHLGRLLEILAGLHSQTLLTTAHPGSYGSLSARNFRVRQGQLTPI